MREWSVRQWMFATLVVLSALSILGGESVFGLIPRVGVALWLVGMGGYELYQYRHVSMLFLLAFLLLFAWRVLQPSPLVPLTALVCLGACLFLKSFGC